MNHWIILYESGPDKTPMRESYWSTHENPKKVTAAWEKKTKGKCVGIVMDNPTKSAIKQKKKPFHVRYINGFTETIWASDGAEAITTAYEAKGMEVIGCKIQARTDDFEGDESVAKINYNVPSEQSKSIKMRKPSRKKLEADNLTFSFMDEMGDQSNMGQLHE